MAVCYFLTVCSASSVDHLTHNASLFNLVENIQVPADAPPPPQDLIPLEIHAYWDLSDEVLREKFRMRFVTVGESGLEQYSNPTTYENVDARFRSRTLGLPLPVLAGRYTLRVECQLNDSEQWQRSAMVWPLVVAVGEPKPRVTH